MTTNVGTIDRILRLVLVVGLIALVFFGPQTPWGWLGLIFVATAFMGYCPAYQIIGLRTCRAPRRSGGAATQS
jgi:hypothetical protein